MKKTKLLKVSDQVDKYLDGLNHKQLVSTRTDKLHAALFHDIATIVVKEYEDLDITSNTELSVESVSTESGIKITITGYIKVDKASYLQIDKTYKPEGWHDEYDEAYTF